MKKACIVGLIVLCSLPVIAQTDGPMTLAELIYQTSQFTKMINDMRKQLDYEYQQVQSMTSNLASMDVHDYQSALDFLNAEATYAEDVVNSAQNLQWNYNGRRYKIWEMMPALQDYRDTMERISSGNATDGEVDETYRYFGIGRALQKQMEASGEFINDIAREGVAKKQLGKEKDAQQANTVEKIINAGATAEGQKELSQQMLLMLEQLYIQLDEMRRTQRDMQILTARLITQIEESGNPSQWSTLPKGCSKEFLLEPF